MSNVDNYAKQLTRLITCILQNSYYNNSDKYCSVCSIFCSEVNIFIYLKSKIKKQLLILILIFGRLLSFGQHDSTFLIDEFDISINSIQYLSSMYTGHFASLSDVTLYNHILSLPVTARLNFGHKTTFFIEAGTFLDLNIGARKKRKDAYQFSN